MLLCNILYVDESEVVLIQLMIVMLYLMPAMLVILVDVGLVVGGLVTPPPPFVTDSTSGDMGPSLSSVSSPSISVLVLQMP